MKKKVVALKYNKNQKKEAPKLIAKGDGLMGEKILTLASMHGIPVHEDKDLVEVLSQFDLYSEIPPETYKIVAEILIFFYNLNKKMEVLNE